MFSIPLLFLYSYTTVWIYASYLGSALSLFFCLSSLSYPSPASFLTPQEFQKILRSAAFAGLCMQRVNKTQAGGFPVSQPASQLSSCHNYEWPQYTLHHMVVSSKKKQSRGPSLGSFLCHIEPLATLNTWEVEQFRKQAFLKSLSQLPRPLKGTNESKAKHDRGDTWKNQEDWVPQVWRSHFQKTATAIVLILLACPNSWPISL